MNLDIFKNDFLTELKKQEKEHQKYFQYKKTIKGAKGNIILTFSSSKDWLTIFQISIPLKKNEQLFLYLSEEYREVYEYFKKLKNSAAPLIWNFK